MKKACLVVDQYQQKNRIFEPGAFRDDINAKYVELRRAFFEKGWDLSTQDINSIEQSDAVIYASDMPKILPDPDRTGKSFLLLWESAFIRPDNYDRAKHTRFKKIFTWHDDFVDGRKYIKINFSHRFPAAIRKDIAHKKSLFTVIAGNKKPPYTATNDLYAERVKAIRWLEQHHPDQFDLYGVGWDRYRFSGSKLIRALNRFPLLAKFVQLAKAERFPSYRGTVDNKKAVMEQYKFSICYENVSDIPGYITEKIFDSFFAGCVPIYWGANNVRDYIPGNCFLDMREFESYETLYRFVSRMSEAEYAEYLGNIEAFLSSSSSTQFEACYFAETVSTEVLI